MGIKRSFVFAFKSPDALKKITLGGLFTFLFFTVFFAFAVVGFLMRLLCDTLEGRDAKLPDWSDLRALFAEGLQPGLVVLAYVSPLIVITIVEMMLGAFSGGPFVYVFLPIQIVIGLAITVLLPLAFMRYIIGGSIVSGFNFAKIIGFIKTNPRNYFAAWGLAFAVNVTAFVFFAGVASFFLTVFYFLSPMAAYTIGLAASLMFGSHVFFLANVIVVHLFAGAYRASKPFADDKEGALRASMSLPPPLVGQVQQ